MRITLYNTASRELEEFVPLNPPHVGIYTCGPTVYGNTHIGHVRAYTTSDVLRRTLSYAGLDVQHVMNVTDVGHMTSDEDEGEDKLELAARKEQKSPWEIARFYEEDFNRSMKLVNVLDPHITCRATEHIEAQIELIKRLEERGFAYQTKVGVIFDVAKFPEYSDFARLNLEGQYHGARTDQDPERRQPWDFALWVTNQPNHIMQWDSPWGRGFPGWHVECSAMSMKYLGEQIDIHTGGIDHIPVHHTNEIAQSQCATGKPFVKYWVHCAFLSVEGEKMSKSLGNLFTLDDVMERGFNPLTLRYLYLGSSYRNGLNFRWDSLQAAQTSLIRLWRIMSELPAPEGPPWEDARVAFQEAVGSDLNTAKALAALWQTIDSHEHDARLAATLLDMDRVLGLDLQRASERLRETEELQPDASQNESRARELAEQRVQLRSEKKFAEADALRDEILELGFEVLDGKAGTTLRPRV